jgi:hypothetical protein
MTYNVKTYKKCVFNKLSKDPLKPLAKQKKQKVDTNYKLRALKEWRDGWFKGGYELNESK